MIYMFVYLIKLISIFPNVNKFYESIKLVGSSKHNKFNLLLYALAKAILKIILTIMLYPLLIPFLIGLIILLLFAIYSISTYIPSCFYSINTFSIVEFFLLYVLSHSDYKY